ncbi:MAG: hypothetical protein Q8J64_06300 [Thermodesulfovibrionales bacterium]|nr:hypothetical protein [Thermodesulfovibrionales bacterium]
MPRLRRLLLFAFLTAFCLSYLGPITEGDFFYHLGQGRSIWEGGIVKSVPSLGLLSQWLGQLALYLTWRLAGFAGVVILRAAVYIAIIWLLYVLMRKAGVGFYQRIFFLILPAHMFISFPSERPQLFGFLFFALTVFLLELRRLDDKSRAHWLVLPVILVWANVHHGFAIGLASVWIYFISRAASRLIRRQPLWPMVQEGAVALLPLVALAFIPGAFAFMRSAAMSFISPPAYMESIQEYLSPVDAVRLGELFPAYWMLLLVAIVTIARTFRNMSPEHILMLSVFGLLPFNGLRFMPFFLMLSPIVACYNIPKKESWEDSRLLFAGFSLVLALWLAFTPFSVRPGISREFPEDAAAFLRQAKPEGKAFNYQGWAGYLSWSVPEMRIFMPVADVPNDVDMAYGEIIWAEQGAAFNMPQWRSLLDAYGLDIIITPGMSPVSGEMFPLIDAIQGDGQWYLIYSDDTANILVRAAAKNARVITRYSLPKPNIYLQTISQAKRYLKDNPRRPVLWRSLGIAHERLGNIKEAEEAYKKVR